MPAAAGRARYVRQGCQQSATGQIEHQWPAPPADGCDEHHPIQQIVLLLLKTREAVQAADRRTQFKIP